MCHTSAALLREMLTILLAVLKANPKAEEDWLRQREIAAQLDTDLVERVDHSLNLSANS